MPRQLRHPSPDLFGPGRGVCQCRGKTRIVGDEAQVGPVVRQMLRLQEQCPAGRNPDPGLFSRRRFGDARQSDLGGDTLVSADAGDDGGRLGEGFALEHLFDAAVFVEMADLLVEHIFPRLGKLKMPRLDDSGVDRPDGDFEDTIPADRFVTVGAIVGELQHRVHIDIPAHRMQVPGPAFVMQQRPLIEGPLETDPKIVPNLPFEPDRRGIARHNAGRPGILFAHALPNRPVVETGDQFEILSPIHRIAGDEAFRTILHSQSSILHYPIPFKNAVDEGSSSATSPTAKIARARTSEL